MIESQDLVVGRIGHVKVDIRTSWVEFAACSVREEDHGRHHAVDVHSQVGLEAVTSLQHTVTTLS